MDPFFTEEQLNNMSRENMMEVMRIMQNQVQKKETEVQLLKDKQKELEFMNAMLSDRLALAQRRRFGSSSEKYADGYEQMDLFNEAEVNADMDTAEIEEEIVIPSHKRKKRTGKKEEDLSNFEVTETIEYKLTGEDRYCPDCGTKYKVVTKEVVKRLKFIPSTFEVEEEVTYVYSCPKCGAMIRPEREFPLIKGSIATPSLVAGIMNAKYVNGMPLARQEREFARYDLNLSTKTMANWIISCADRYLGLLYGQMKEEFLKSRYIHCDETRIQVIDEPDQKGSSQNWMWVYLTDRYSEAPQMVLFDYERTRAGYHPVNFLGDTFHGYLTCDGYQAYHRSFYTLSLQQLFVILVLRLLQSLHKLCQRLGINLDSLFEQRIVCLCCHRKTCLLQLSSGGQQIQFSLCISSAAIRTALCRLLLRVSRSAIRRLLTRAMCHRFF